ncbi:MAG: cytochrome c3 family protein [Verrucomicrobiota bacterium]|nr:cytochrome c3 family protein [Verrucomicrobiota bacterium]
MSNVFPKWTNRLPAFALVGGLLAGIGVVAGVTYYFTPKYTRVGYQPLQPVAFSHKVHAGQLGMDCRYCHDGVEKSWYSNIPSAETCMKCHTEVLKDDPRLAPVKESFETGKPLPWVQVHRTPDYVYFNHAVHVNRGVSCVHCHGRVDEMDEVKHDKSLSMAFCLDCHRNPHEKLRPLDKVTDLGWEAPPGHAKREGSLLAHKWKVRSSESCSVCHR